MKKVTSLIAILAMGTMLAGCYSKACEEPQPAPYKDMAPAPVAVEERPVHHHRHHHRHHHHKHHKAMKNSEKKMSEENNQMQGSPDNTTEPNANTTTQQ